MAKQAVATLFGVVVSVLSVLLATLTSPLAQAADGAALFTSCKLCHGNAGEGNRKTGAPNIAGMDAWYIERQLENFALGRRGVLSADAYGVQMKDAVSAVPTAKDRAAVATYIAGLAKVSRRDTAPDGKADLKNGASQYNALCSSCHQANGQGNQTLNAPRLAGVDPVYLTRQYLNFRTALRGFHAEDKPGKQMAAISKMLPDAKAERDVLAYIATLPF